MKKIKITFEENPKKKNKYKKYPRIDLDRLASTDDETAEQIQIDYIKAIKTKVLKRYLLPTAIISALLICCCATLSLYLNSQNLEIYAQNTAISERAEELAKEVRELKSSEKEDFNDRLKKLQEIIENNNETSSTQNNEYNNQQINNSNNDDRLCDVPDCNYRANRGSYYCSLHECSKAGCHNQRANDLSLYCVDHKCIVTDCNNGRSLNGFYCLMHSK